jgi:dTDP-4-dehydrorhamnose reductase
MRLLITGGSGYLGRHLVPIALPDHKLVYTYFSQDPLARPEGVQLDLRDRDAVLRLVGDFRPNVIIHTAASNRSADMERSIVDGTRYITEAATANDARLIHMSTDVVFDGTQAPYAESAEPTPIHAYGRAKAAAELIVKQWHNHVIVRTSLIYGLDIMDNGTKWMVNALQAGEPVTLFANHLRNPVWAVSLSNALLELAHNDFTGMLNVAGEQEMTRAEFGAKMLDWWGVEGHKTISAEADNSGRWPVDCRLDIAQAQAVLQTPLPSLDSVMIAVTRS